MKPYFEELVDRDEAKADRAFVERVAAAMRQQKNALLGQTPWHRIPRPAPGARDLDAS